jgi:predicted DNA-binding protein with PD1-like motif
MIVLESQRRRGLIGRLETGKDVLESMRDLCVREKVETATFTGFGYIRNPTIQIFRPEHRRYVKAPETHEGDYLATSINGSVSFHQDARELNVSIAATSVKDGSVIAGELISGEVISFEFSIQSFDDVRLFRDVDPNTGLRQWVMMEIIEEETVEKVEDSGVAKSTKKVAPEPPVALGDTHIDIKTGDFLEHPKLGMCEVVELIGDSRLAIKLPNDRVVELHRGIVRLEFVEEKDEHSVYRVSIKRKRA